MNTVKRIASSDRLPASRQRSSAHVPDEIEIAPERMQIVGASGFAPAPSTFRSVAPFIAQYVDQHFPWPRSPNRKEARRRRANDAYVQADMLPDILAQTLRLRTVDRKL
jgi:hypothetical protein